MPTSWPWWSSVGPSDSADEAAIAEFNEAHDRRKLGKIHGLRFELPRAEFMDQWHEKMYVFHQFDHPRYADFEGRIDERWLQAHRLEPS